MKAVLNLTLTVDEDHVAIAARELRSRLAPPQWKVLAALAASVVAEWESTALGQRILVVPATEREAEVSKALQLRVAGPGLA